MTLVSERLVHFVVCDDEVEDDLVCLDVVRRERDLVTARLLELFCDPFDGVFGCLYEPQLELNHGVQDLSLGLWRDAKGPWYTVLIWSAGHLYHIS